MQFYEPALTFALTQVQICAGGSAVSDPQSAPAPINYSITAMALVIAARAHSLIRACVSIQYITTRLVQNRALRICNKILKKTTLLQ